MLPIKQDLILQFEQICFGVWKNKFYNMEKYILQHGQIHLAMWTNTFCNVDKWIV